MASVRHLCCSPAPSRDCFSPRPAIAKAMVSECPILAGPKISFGKIARRLGVLIAACTLRKAWSRDTAWHSSEQRASVVRAGLPVYDALGIKGIGTAAAFDEVTAVGPNSGLRVCTGGRARIGGLFWRGPSSSESPQGDGRAKCESGTAADVTCSTRRDASACGKNPLLFTEGADIDYDRD